MLMGDLLSLRQLRTPVKIIVFRNESLAFVELEMKAAGVVEFGTDLENPNFAKLRRSCGPPWSNGGKSGSGAPADRSKLSSTMDRRWSRFR